MTNETLAERLPRPFCEGKAVTETSIIALAFGMPGEGEYGDAFRAKVRKSYLGGFEPLPGGVECSCTEAIMQASCETRNYPDTGVLRMQRRFICRHGRVIRSEEEVIHDQ